MTVAYDFTAELGRADFRAADLADKAARRASAAAERIEPRELTDAIEAFIQAEAKNHDGVREEAKLVAYEAQHLGTVLNNFRRQADTSFRALERAGVMTPNDLFDILAEAVSERMTKEAAAVFLASVKAGAN